MRTFALALPVAVVALGCTGSAPKPPPPSTSPFAVERFNEDAVLWNGLIGLRIGPNGTGKSRPFFDIDEYDTTGEEKIRTLPSPLDPMVKIGSEDALIGNDTEFTQSMDPRTGVLTQSGRCLGGRVHVKCETVLAPQERIFAQRWTIETLRSTVVSVGFAGRPAVPMTFGGPDNGPPYELVRNEPLRSLHSRDVLGRIVVIKAAKVQAAGLGASPGNPYQVEFTWSLAQSSNAPELVRARGGAPGQPPHSAAGCPSYGYVETASRDFWEKRWKTDIEIDGPTEDQEALRYFLFYLRSAIAPEAGMGVSPFGLSNDLYSGHVFWDQDVWVFPALALIDPETAKAIPSYRLATANGARENYAQWIAAGRPVAHGSLGPCPKTEGIMFPWESSVSGHEMVVGQWTDPKAGPSRHEAHVTGSVLWGLQQAAALGLADPKQVETIGKEAANFYIQRAQKRSDGQYEIPWVMSPDENHVGGNDLYTNLVAKRTIDTYAHERFPEGIPMVLPHDEVSFLNYNGDRFQGYKQSAAILSIYPLQHPAAEKEAAVMMGRFADKVMDTGPAMSRSLDALIWARLGESEKAYEAWHQSWKDFVKPPLMLFAEKRQVPVTYFTTGAAGSLQTVLFGFLGIRIDSQKDPAASWSKKLIGEHWLTIKPHLPQAWKSVKFKNFCILGHRYTLFATHSGVTVTQGD